MTVDEIMQHQLEMREIAQHPVVGPIYNALHKWHRLELSAENASQQQLDITAAKLSKAAHEENLKLHKLLLELTKVRF